MQRGELLLGLAVSCSFAWRAAAAPAVWAIDDGEKIKRDATSLAFENGSDNPVWKPGGPISLFALRNETVGFQIVVEADATPLSGVTVELALLTGPFGAKIQNAPGATDPTKLVGRKIERFVEHYFQVLRQSSENGTSASLGWSAGSGPAPGAWTGWIPDALIPVEVAPAWSPYPMNVAPKSNGVVWIDVTTAIDQPPGHYQGDVIVKAGTTPLATLPVDLEVLGATLPDRPLETMLFYETPDLKRVGSIEATEKQLWMLFHRHRLSPMHGAKSLADLAHHLPALDGSLYTAKNGYEGPGVGLGDGILSLGTYGTFGAPTTATLSAVEAIADQLAQANLFSTTDVFVYAVDESCSSSYGKTWKSLIAGSSNPNVKQVAVGWTCSSNPATQPVDIPIVWGGAYDAKTAAAARAIGKQVWVYNGSRPGTGSFLTDAPAVDIRVNGWISKRHDTGRWFYWETAFWYDNNKGGLGAYDPFVTSETFHNSWGDECQGDGVLVYPGKQVDVFTAHSVGIDAVLPSIRLKNVRRGVEDAGYYQLAHAASPSAAEAIVDGLLGKVLSDAAKGAPVSYPEKGKPYFEARKALAALIPVDAPSPDGGVGAGGDAGGRGTDGGADTDASAGTDAAGAAGASSAGAGGGVSGGGGAGGGNDARSHADTPSGCGCRATDSTRASFWAAALALVIGASARRRRLIRQRITRA